MKDEKTKSLARRWMPPVVNYFDDMERSMEETLDHFPARAWMSKWSRDGGEIRMPSVDIVSRDHEVFVRAEMPGVEKDAIDIAVSGTVLTIRAKHQLEDLEEKGQYHRHELRYGEYLRTIGLPAEVDTDSVKARFKNGVLEITLPKLENAHAHTIAIDQISPF